MREEVSAYFKQKGWWTQIQFTTDKKNLSALSGGLSPATRAEFESWLKQRKWYYESVK
jgi:N-acetylmuramoyl-L-alanine amidase